MSMTIGIDPHKGSHTAVAIDGDEHPVARLTVTADRCQTQRLLAWAEPLGVERTWAIESATGLGRLLAQQLVAAGENVVDVPPTLAARVRLLGSTKAAKNDPNGALATAVAGLRRCGLRAVASDEHSGGAHARRPPPGVDLVAYPGGVDCTCCSGSWRPAGRLCGSAPSVPA